MNRKLILATTVALLIGISLGYGLQNGFWLHKTPKVTANVYVFKETPYGKELIANGNSITDIGEKFVRNLCGFNNVTNHNATQYISLGNSTVATSKTKLDTEATTTGFTRAEASTKTAWEYSGDFAYNMSKKFTATGNIEINCAGLQWSGTSNTDNNLFALASLGGSQAFQNNWNCTIVWMIVWDAN